AVGGRFALARAVDSRAQIQQAWPDFSGAHFGVEHGGVPWPRSISFGIGAPIPVSISIPQPTYSISAGLQPTSSPSARSAGRSSPSNHQTYTLQNTTLSDLHLSNSVAKDASAIGAWQSALASAPL